MRSRWTSRTCITVVISIAILSLLFSDRFFSGLASNTPPDSPTGWRASYTQIYFDDVESLQPSLGPQFALDSAGTLTGITGEVISGTRSIKGSYTGTGSITTFLQTNPTVLSLAPGQSYRVTFTYRILTAPDNGFRCLFFSSTGASIGDFVPGITINGSAGSSGTATLTTTLHAFSDYEVLWNIIGTGAISIDDIRIEQLSTGLTVATENGELSARLHTNGTASVTTDPSQVVDGAASLQLANFASLETNPAALSLSPNTYYVVEFKYRILNRGTDNNIAWVNLQPAGNNDQSLGINSGALLKNIEATGSFSTGALTGGAAPYVLRIYAAQNAVIVLDDIRLTRADPTQIFSQPAAWTALA